MNTAFAPLFTLQRSHGIAHEPIELTDGRLVELAPVNPQDASAERAFVGALSLTSRYRRFHFGLRELSPEAAQAMTEIDQHHHVAFVARAADDDAAAIVADARYVMRADSADAEFAIAVADDWQGVGLGRALLMRLAAQARANGVQRLFGDVLWGNPSMLALMRSLGAKLRRLPGDSTVVRVEFEFELSENLANEVRSAPAPRS
ncbi:MAG: GNAT family N-acetyltransferase [Burkholderiales bacterium]